MALARKLPPVVVAAAAAVALCARGAAAAATRDGGDGALAPWARKGGLAERHAAIGGAAALRRGPDLEQLKLGPARSEKQVESALGAAFEDGDLAAHVFRASPENLGFVPPGQPDALYLPAQGLITLVDIMQLMSKEGRFYKALSTSQIRPEFGGFGLYSDRGQGWLLHLPSCRVQLACTGDMFVPANLLMDDAQRQKHITDYLKKQMRPMNSLLRAPVRHFVYEPSEEAWAQKLCDESNKDVPLRCHSRSDTGAFAAIKEAMLKEVLHHDKSEEGGFDLGHWTKVVADCPLDALVGFVAKNNSRQTVAAIAARLGEEVPQLSGKTLPVVQYHPGSPSGGAALEVVAWATTGGGGAHGGA